ncbi:MAG: GAP family protein [Actinobacteria bacterium]|nr:GAP family protein [Actinomycetota bacterium]
MHDLSQLIPIAAGIILSPLPIAAIIAVLLSPRARTNGFAYAAAFWSVCFGVTAVTALTTSHASSAGGTHGTATTILGLVLTIGFLALAVASWVTRPKHGAPAKAPGWLQAIDGMSAGRAFGLGIVMALTNGKNIPLELKAGALIGSGGHGAATALAVAALFALGASLGILVPTLLAATGIPAVTTTLARLKALLISHNAVIMTVLFAVLAAVELSNLLPALTK